jgi:hypothetical protein
MWGPVEITAERLQRITDKYNKARSQPLNQNDYAPILINHNRDVELVKGRVLADLEVGDWVDPDTGTKGKGLFGTLRVDIPDAIQKVESGQYAQVSMSFDEDDDTLWEVSFVAVEAARRSQALEQGDTQMSVELQAQLKAASDKHIALQGKVRDSVTVRNALVLSATENLTAMKTALEQVHAELSTGLKSAKVTLLSAQFKGFVRSGQLTKIEFDKIDLGKMADMTADALTAILGAYKARPVSPHVQQFGQNGSKGTAAVSAKLTPSELRAAAKAQKAGKAVSLEVEEPTGDKGQGDKGKEKQAEYDAADGDMDDFAAALKKLGEVEPIVSKSKEFIGKVNESLKKLGEQNEKDKDVA